MAIRERRIHWVLACVAVLMFGFAFALVPLYDTLCRVLGINGRIEQTEYRAAVVGSEPRDIRIELIATNAKDLPWSFYPLVRAMTVQPGEMHTVQFHAKNTSDGPMTVQAIPSVTPTEGARYLVKADCFCFEEQTLEAGESMKLALAFYVDPQLPGKYRTLTLSYALFEAARQ
jgi:cytochrome c oxidase assembly protein subunit 11